MSIRRPDARRVSRIALVASAALLLALPVLSSAQATTAPRRFTFDDVLSLQQVADPQISPDGKWIAYVVTATDLKANAPNSDIWLVGSGGGTPIPLTRSPKADAQPRWSPDGKTLAFVSARDERAQLYRINPFGGEAEKLSDSKTGVGTFQWSPDGTRIAFTAQQAPTAEQEQKQKDRDDPIVVDQDFRMGRIWVLDVSTKEAKELVKENVNAGDPQWSPDGKHLAFSATLTPRADDGSRSDIFIADVSSGSVRKLLENAGPDNAPRWSPDGRSLALLTRGSGLGVIGMTRVAIISPDGGAPRVIAPDFDYQAGPVTWSPDGRTLWFTAQTRTTSQLYSVPVAGGTPRQLTSIDGVIGGLSLSKNRDQIALVTTNVQQPTELHVASVPRATEPASLTKLTKLTSHNAQLAQLALGKSELIRWKSGDMEIEGLLVYPVDYKPGQRYPTIAFIHGGPAGVWSQVFPGSWGNYAHVWAANGWVSFFPNVRGSTGYGEKFLLSNIKDWGGGDYRDIQVGLDTLVGRGIADPDKLAQSGWSYGGYMTAWTVTQTTRFKAAMIGAGLTNMYSMYSTNDLQSTLDAYFGAEPWDDKQEYEKASAMTFIKQAKTPTLILHGQQDQRVPIGQAQEMYQGLKRNDVPVELVFYPRAGHGLSEPRHQLDKMRREYEWISRWVLGAKPVQ